MKQNYNKQESGRSMVEMLGVLAIIGVLSVGGISGYTTAMNKHKANEILNAAAVRAMAVSAQIQSGVDPSTATGSVTTEDVGCAEIGSASPVGSEQFKLEFSTPVDTAICNQMKNIAGENSAVGVTCDRLLYNNDMSNGVENKNIESVGEDGVYTCKTVGFDPASKCESCKTGYSGLSCNTCAEGYESDGEGGCQEEQTDPPFARGILEGCHFGCNDDKNFYSAATTPKADNIVCPPGYTWAKTTDVLNSTFGTATYEESEARAALFTDTTLCQTEDGDACRSDDTYYMWLQDCDGTCTASGDAWSMNYLGEVRRSERDNDGFSRYIYALCVR